MNKNKLFIDSGNNSINDFTSIAPDETFRFACGPNSPCYNLCCSELTLPLTPYDIMRLRQQLDMSSESFMQAFADMNFMPDTGLPLPMLRMVESPDAPCPFVTPAGCSVYEDRPSACRAYPLGRGTKLAENGIAEHFFIIAEEHCKGFEQGERHTPRQWFHNQQMEKYICFNDIYMRLMSMVRASGNPLDKKMSSMSFLCLYQLDLFRQLIEKMRIFSRVALSAEKQELIMQNTPEGDEACLFFAFDWLELALFGKAENLRRRQ